MKKNWLVVLMISIYLTSCGILPGSGGNELEGTAWTLVSYDGKSLIEASSMTAQFNDVQVSGSASCNHYFGGYKIRGTQIQIEGLGWTEMACMDPEGIMQQEQELMLLFSKADVISRQGNILRITTTSGEILIFNQTGAGSD